MKTAWLKNNSLLKRLLPCLKISVVFILFLTPAFAQSNYSETLTITTYYPSPYGVYRNLEVKRGLAVGDITKGPLGSMDNLTSGQLYINGSVILNSLPGTPAPAFSKAGQVIYVNNTTSGERMLKFHDGNAWVNASYTGYPACLTNQACTACPSSPPNQQCRVPCTACPACETCGTIYKGMYTETCSLSCVMVRPYIGTPYPSCSWKCVPDGGGSCSGSNDSTVADYPTCSAQGQYSQAGMYGCQLICNTRTVVHLCTK